MLKEVEYPKHLRHGLRCIKRDHPHSHNLRIFGSDTETCMGDPMTVQISGPATSTQDADLAETFFSYVDRENIFEEFWRWIRGRLRPGGVNICYFHKLNFDLRVLFAKFHLIMYEQGGDINFTITVDGQELHIKMLYGKVNKADITCGKTRLQIFDSIAFTQASLDRSLKMFQIPQDKLKQPPGLGRIRYDSLPAKHPDRLAFEEYSRQDSRAELHLGLKIMEFHEAYKVGPSLSLPSYAAKVFRRHFLRVGESIPFPPTRTVKAAEKSYHGGKNGYYLSAPKIAEDLYEVDINSAYPNAMSQLPTLTRGKFWKVDAFDAENVGIYCLSGRVDPKDPRCKYPLIYDHAFKRVSGEFKELWHSCYEVQRILALPPQAIRIDRVWGYVWKEGKDGSNPFRRFVEHFYGKKEATPKTDPYYHFYKIVLNALYGKLVSTIEVRSAEGEEEIAKLRELGVDLPDYIRIDQRFDKVLGRYVNLAKNWRAGSLYNPFLGSLITGHARAALYDLETELEAVHSATDSVKTKYEIEPVKGLGGLKIECYGRCYLFRNKLYLHFSKDAKFCGHTTPPFKYPPTYAVEDGFGVFKMVPHPRAGQPLVDDDGQHLCKIALHGYKGPVWVLFEARRELISQGKMRYKYVHVIGLREGLRHGDTPCNFIMLEEDINLFQPYEVDTILTFIIKRGGFSIARETSNKGEIRRWTFKESRIRGLVNNAQGWPMDDILRMCIESGYMREDSSINDLSEAVDSSLRGEKIYGTNTSYEQTDIIYPEPTEAE